MPRNRNRRSRFWMFTLFNEEVSYEELLNMVGGGGCATYIVFQKERCPTTNRVHWQGYIEFASEKSLSAGKRYFPGQVDPHLEPRYGTAEDAKKYCTKVDTRVGLNTYFKGEMSGKTSLKKLVMKGASMQEVFEELPSTFVRNHAGIKAAKDLYVQPRSIQDDFSIIVLLGLTGAGKTYKAYQLDKDLFRVDLHNKSFPFNGYDYQETILLDDYRNQITYTKLLEILDVYKKSVNVKFGSRKWCVKNVIITSVRPINDWHQKVSDKSELYRRLKQFGAVYKMVDRVPMLLDSSIFDDQLDFSIPDHQPEETPESLPPIRTLDLNSNYDF